MRIRFLISVCIASFLFCLFNFMTKLQDFEKTAYHANLIHQRQVYVNNLETFKQYQKESDIMAIRVNNFSKHNVKNDAVLDLACASELFVAECPNAGLAAILLNTIDHINFCEKLGAKPTIFWRQCGTICPNDPTINAWGLYFEPVNPKIEEKAEAVVCLGGASIPYLNMVKDVRIDQGVVSWVNSRMLADLVNLSFRKRNALGYKDSGIITPAVQIKTNQLIQKYAKIQPKIQKMVDQFYSRYLDKYQVVAVHVRGTDHDLETDNRRLVPISAYIQNIKEFLYKNPNINRIFVASDNFESIKRFSKEFEGIVKVVFTKALRAREYHGPAAHASGIDAFKLGSQVLVDILLMAKCKYFFHVESSVAALVTYFNPSIKSYFVDNEKLLQPDFSSENDSKVGAKQQRKEFSTNISLDEQEISKDDAERFQCFLQNRRFSVCPNFHEGKLVYFKDVLEMTHLL